MRDRSITTIITGTALFAAVLWLSACTNGPVSKYREASGINVPKHISSKELARLRPIASRAMPRTQALDAAMSHMQRRDWSGAHKALTDLVAAMPADWAPYKMHDNELHAAVWGMGDYICLIANKSAQKIKWVGPSYSQAYYFLAFAAIEQKMPPQKALEYIESALRLEPDQPMLHIEKGTILLQMKQHQAALDSYRSAMRARKCIPPHVQALALRQQGISLVALGHYEEAQWVLGASQEIAPGDEVTIRELRRIKKLHGGKQSSGNTGVADRKRRRH